MVSQFFSRKKTCRFQGKIQSNGITTCKKDGSRRNADKCSWWSCPKWKRTPWKAFLWWWDYGTICYSWKDLIRNWKRRYEDN